MRLALKPHHDTPCDAVESLTVDVSRTRDGVLDLHHFATGSIAGLRLPPPASPSRTDNLWQHTCFEAFIRDAPNAAYREINLSPSTQWAAYRFTAYREGMADLEIAAPHIETKSTATTFKLAATLTLPAAPVLWHLALSAVIEETSGRKSYWALTHAPGKPDFHHPDCFSLELPPA